MKRTSKSKSVSKSTSKPKSPFQKFNQEKKRQDKKAAKVIKSAEETFTVSADDSTALPQSIHPDNQAELDKIAAEEKAMAATKKRKERNKRKAKGIKAKVQLDVPTRKDRRDALRLKSWLESDTTKQMIKNLDDNVEKHDTDKLMMFLNKLNKSKKQFKKLKEAQEANRNVLERRLEG